MAGEACRTLESGRRVSAPFVPIRRDQPPVGELLPGCHPEIRCGVTILGGAFFLNDSFLCFETLALLFVKLILCIGVVPDLKITQGSGDSLGILSLDFALVYQRLREDPGVVLGPGGRGGARRFSLDPEIAFRTRSPTKEEMVDRRVEQQMRKAADVPEANLLPDVTHRSNKEVISIRCLI
ncbi:hypothetical protein F2Q69_00035097 [Brassica cretica]|uniref:Uncharacterized protein n=1 Tax=Brassica cretica TaxID=69181 RepID=A0A8S9SF01_BRACR|nr:hypothetical protein F2Q69_00035097 [Brassica cretica]